jgi:Xaa-Pro aminopeptidase
MLYTLRGGVSVAEVTRAGVAVARQAGLDACLYRSPNHAGTFLGHCIGCWYHEAPELHIDSEDVLESNMLVVLEPILGQAGVGGAKIEDVILVKPDGAERLSQLDIRTWSV